MRKSFFTLLFLLVLAISSQAQTQDKSQEKIKPDKRIKGGFASSRLLNTGWEGSSAPGFALGLSLDFRLTRAFSVQPELLYLEKGSRERVGPPTDTEFDLTLDYVEIPVLAKYHLPVAGLVRPHIYVGPYLSFLIANNSNTELVDNQQPTPDQLVNNANETDFGAVLGVGTDLHFPFNIMSAEIRYDLGFSDVFSEAASQSAQNGSLMFMVGFRF